MLSTEEELATDLDISGAASISALCSAVLAMAGGAATPFQ